MQVLIAQLEALALSELSSPDVKAFAAHSISVLESFVEAKTTNPLVLKLEQIAVTGIDAMLAGLLMPTPSAAS